MKVEVHLITFNEEAFIAYALRHYRTYCARMVVHDAFSKDRTREIARSLAVSSATRAARNRLARQPTMTPALMSSPRSTCGTTRTIA